MDAVRKIKKGSSANNGSVSGPDDAIDKDVSDSDGLSVGVANGQAGRYYIFVFANAPNPNATQPYTMQVIYP